MPLDVSLHFNGNCREAVTFYADIFHVPRPRFMTFGDMPHTADMLNDADKQRVLSTSLFLCGGTVSFSDCAPGRPALPGDSIRLAYSSDDPEEILRLFDALSEGGRVDMALQKTFWCDLFGMVTDRFGVPWNLRFTG